MAYRPSRKAALLGLVVAIVLVGLVVVLFGDDLLLVIPVAS